MTVRLIDMGDDTTGRPILMTTHMRAWWIAVTDALGFTPVIVQGPWQELHAGGAAASAGTHDQGGCLDLRVWDLSPAQVDAIIHETRQRGAASWRRDRLHGGMDPHVHLVLGSDAPLSLEAARQWQEYLSGGDGLRGSTPDYEWRPTPLVTDWKEPDDMPYLDWPEADRKALAKDVATALLAAVVPSEVSPKKARKVSGMLTSIERDAHTAAKTP